MTLRRLEHEPEEAGPDQPDELYIGACRCGARWCGESIAHCASCHLTFTSVTGFDEHRHAGACHTPQQMRERGYEPNDQGYWRRPLDASLKHWGGS